MKVAISAQGKDGSSAVDPRFGRAPWFVIMDSDSGEIVEVIDNQAAQDAAHGAGINAATRVAEAGVHAVLTGRVGPKAFTVLDAAGIKVVSDVQGSVQQALEAFRKGDASFDYGPTSDGHSSGPGAVSYGNSAGAGAGAGGGRGKCGGKGRGGGGGRGRGGCGCRGGKQNS